jgi:hypothetical protein
MTCDLVKEESVLRTINSRVDANGHSLAGLVVEVDGGASLTGAANDHRVLRLPSKSLDPREVDCQQRVEHRSFAGGMWSVPLISVASREYRSSACRVNRLAPY